MVLKWICVLLLCTNSSSLIWGMIHAEREVGEQLNPPAQLLFNNPRIAEPLVILKEKIATYKKSITLKGFINSAFIGGSYLCTSYGLLNNSSPLLWGGFGCFATAIIINALQVCDALDFKSEMDERIDCLSQGIPYSDDSEDN